MYAFLVLKVLPRRLRDGGEGSLATSVPIIHPLLSLAPFPSSLSIAAVGPKSVAINALLAHSVQMAPFLSLCLSSSLPSSAFIDADGLSLVEPATGLVIVNVWLAPIWRNNFTNKQIPQTSFQNFKV